MASELGGDVWKEVTNNNEFLFDLDDEVVHLQEKGRALCWKDWNGTQVRAKKKHCFFSIDPATSELCYLCYNGKKRRTEQ